MSTKKSTTTANIFRVNSNIHLVSTKLQLVSGQAMRQTQAHRGHVLNSESCYEFSQLISDTSQQLHNTNVVNTVNLLKCSNNIKKVSQFMNDI